MTAKLIFEIHSSYVHERSGKSAKGNDYKLREQEAWVQIGDAPYTQKTKVMLEDGQPPYQPGKYLLHERSFSIGRFDALEVRPFLVPVAVQPAQKAS